MRPHTSIKVITLVLCWGKNSGGWPAKWGPLGGPLLLSKCKRMVAWPHQVVGEGSGLLHCEDKATGFASG